MADLGISDYMLAKFPPEEQDSVKEMMMFSLLKIHEISRMELDTNLYLYQINTEAYQEILNLMVPRMVELKTRYDGMFNDSSFNQQIR